MNFSGKIRITGCSGKISKKHDVNGKADPYLKFTYHGNSKKTEVVHNTLDPEWKAVFEFDTSTESDDRALFVECWDKDVIKDDFIGKGKVEHLEQYVDNAQQVTVPILGKGEKSAKEGDVTFRIVVMFFGSAPDHAPFYASTPTGESSTQSRPLVPVYSSSSLNHAHAAAPPYVAAAGSSSSSSSSNNSNNSTNTTTPTSTSSPSTGVTLPPPVYATSSSSSLKPSVPASSPIYSTPGK